MCLFSVDFVDACAWIGGFARVLWSTCVGEGFATMCVGLFCVDFVDTWAYIGGFARVLGGAHVLRWYVCGGGVSECACACFVLTLLICRRIISYL